MYKQIQILPGVRNQGLQLAGDGTLAKYSPQIMREIEAYLKGVEQNEEEFCRSGHNLLSASDHGPLDAAIVDRVFGILPRLIEYVQSAPTFLQQHTQAAQSSQTNTTRSMSTSDGPTLVMPATAPFKFDDPIKREIPPGNIIRPFWSCGRWHAAVRRPLGETVLVDPWGDYDCKDSHVGSILRYVIWACVLTVKH